MMNLVELFNACRLSMVRSVCLRIALLLPSVVLSQGYIVVTEDSRHIVFDFSFIVQLKFYGTSLKGVLFGYHQSLPLQAYHMLNICYKLRIAFQTNQTVLPQ